MEYNTTREKIIMPEYGRLVQNLVEFAITIPDRDERNHFAESIVRVMANCNPQNRNIPGFRHKLWDHLAMISDYKLDIDYPFPANRKAIEEKPERVPYPTNKIKYRHYGHLVETLLDEIARMPESDERNELTKLAEGQMRRSLEMWNKDSLNDKKIRKDFDQYTNRNK